MNPLYLHVEGADLSRTGTGAPVATRLVAQYKKIGLRSSKHRAEGSGGCAQGFHENIIQIPRDGSWRPQHAVVVVIGEVCALRHGPVACAGVIEDVRIIYPDMDGAIKRGRSLALPLEQIQLTVSRAIRASRYPYL